MSHLTAIRVLEEKVAMFASGDLSGATAVVAAEYIDHQGLGAGAMRGIEGFTRVVRTIFSVYDRLEISIEDPFGVEDRAVARIRWRGRQHAGEAVDRETINIVRVAQGRAVERWGARA